MQRGIASFSVCAALFVTSQAPAGPPCDVVELQASDAEDGDHFGASVAVRGRLVVVGASSDDEAAGSAYVYRRTSTGWVEIAKLVSFDPAPYEQFGFAVALTRDRIVVSAVTDGTDKKGVGAGAVYVFLRVGAIWVPEAKLMADGGDPGDHFGNSIGIADERIVVGARSDEDEGPGRGAAYVFHLRNGNWTEEIRLEPPDPNDFDVFGSGVAIGRERVAIGALGARTGGNRVGAVYVYLLQSTGWEFEAKLVASDPDELDWLGRSVAITPSGRYIVAGADGDDEVAFHAGAAYVFGRQGTSWVQRQKLVAFDGRSSDMFGQSVAIKGRLVAVGSPYEDITGATYLYLRENGTFGLVAKVEAPDETVVDDYGYSVALSSRNLVVGAPLHPFEFGPGATYIHPHSCLISASTP